MRLVSSLLALLLPLACVAPPSDAARDVVLIVIDTLRADHVGAYGYPMPTTPFLDSLAEEGVVFENAFSSSSHTAPSHASMFTSLYPEAHGVLRNGATLRAEQVTTLAGALAQRGFATALFPSVNFLSEIAEGFDHVEDYVWEKKADYRRAAETVATAMAWLEANREQSSLFMVIHLYDVHDHGPQSSPPVRYMGRIRQAMRSNGEPLRRHLELVQAERSKHSTLRRQFLRYDAQLAYVDREIARFYAAFERQRGLEDTLWIVTSDHGEGLGNHGLMGHGRHLYNEQLRVPLIVHRPSRQDAPLRIDHQVRLVDLLPTTLELAGVPEGTLDQQIEGLSLAPLLSSPDAELPIDYAYAQRRPIDARRSAVAHWEAGLVIAAQNSEEKYIYYENGPPEYFDLVRDPFELENLADRESARAERLRRWLLDTYSRTRASRPEGEAEIQPEHLDELRALGYLD